MQSDLRYWNQCPIVMWWNGNCKNFSWQTLTNGTSSGSCVWNNWTMSLIGIASPWLPSKQPRHPWLITPTIIKEHLCFTFFRVLSIISLISCLPDHSIASVSQPTVLKPYKKSGSNYLLVRDLFGPHILALAPFIFASSYLYKYNNVP